MRGLAFAVASGICYGLYTGFLTLAQTQGVWGSWFAGLEWGEGQAALGAFVVAFALAALAAGLNDLISGVWSVAVCAKNRQVGDLWIRLRRSRAASRRRARRSRRSLRHHRLRHRAQLAAAAGNPGVIVPIAALNCAIGAVLGRIFFKQSLGAHKVAGIAICLFAAALIGGTASPLWAPAHSWVACSPFSRRSDGVLRAAWRVSAPS